MQLVKDPECLCPWDVGESPGFQKTPLKAPALPLQLLTPCLLLLCPFSFSFCALVL